MWTDHVYHFLHCWIFISCRFTSCLSFNSILNELNDYAGQREVVAEDMGHKVYGELMRYSQDLKGERKHVSAKYMHLRHLHARSGEVQYKLYFKYCCVLSDKQHLQEGRKTQQYLDQCWKHMDNVSHFEMSEVLIFISDFMIFFIYN